MPSIDSENGNEMKEHSYIEEKNTWYENSRYEISIKIVKALPFSCLSLIPNQYIALNVVWHLKRWLLTIIVNVHRGSRARERQSLCSAWKHVYAPRKIRFGSSDDIPVHLLQQAPESILGGWKSVF